MTSQKNASAQLPILFVDDDPMAHAIFDEYLAGRTLHHARSAESALKLVQEQDIPIVITDIYMEEMDGITLTKELKKMRNIVQVIIVTGVSETANLISALDAGANDFLVKPVKQQALLEALESTEARLRRWKTALKDLFLKKEFNSRRG